MATTIGSQREGVRLQRSLTLPNDVGAIPLLGGFIDAICEDAGVDMAMAMTLNLAMEEAVVNVMLYAYPEGTKGDVGIDACVSDDAMTFIISDTGMPFDPTAQKDADITLPVEERPIGGLGIHLIREIMDNVSYDYVDRHNVLTLTKNIT